MAGIELLIVILILGFFIICGVMTLTFYTAVIGAYRTVNKLISKTTED